MENERTTTEDRGRQVEPQGKPQENPEKKFTQADVDRIVKERLSRQKASHAEEINEENKAKEHELGEKEAELIRRESRVSCKEYLLEKGLPVGLLDVIDTSDSESFQKRTEKVLEMFGGSRRAKAPLASTEPPIHGGSVAAAFRNPVHKPKPFGAIDYDN